MARRRTGSIRKHREKYQARWTDAEGKACSRMYATRDDAEMGLKRVLLAEEEVRRGLRRPHPTPRTFDELAVEWTERRGARKRSLPSDKSYLRAHLTPAFGTMRLRDIQPSDIERFKAGRTHLSEVSVNHHLSLLISMLRHAVDLGWLERLPKITKYKDRGPGVNFKYLRTREEVRRLLSAAQEESELAGALYATAVYTGLRAGELAGLRWDDIDFERRLITVQRSYDGPTKNGEARHVPLLDAVAPTLRSWRLRTPGSLVFPTRKRSMRQRSDRVFQETLRRVLNAARFERGYITFHSLRHTFASHWMMECGDLFKLQRILGHKSIKMTQRYAHLAPHAFADDYGRLSSLAPVDGSVTSLAAARGANMSS